MNNIESSLKELGVTKGIFRIHGNGYGFCNKVFCHQRSLLKGTIEEMDGKEVIVHIEYVNGQRRASVWGPADNQELASKYYESLDIILDSKDPNMSNDFYNKYGIKVQDISVDDDNSLLEFSEPVSRFMAKKYLKMQGIKVHFWNLTPIQGKKIWMVY